jgi:hypothetical protein
MGLAGAARRVVADVVGLATEQAGGEEAPRCVRADSTAD